jgi:hypothetical protein
MKPLNEEIQFVKAASDELAEYLLSGVTNWRLAGPPSLPSLSPGYVLLYQRRLNGRHWTTEEQTFIDEFSLKIDAIRAQWRSAWLDKERREIPQRIRLWRNYLLEFEADRKGGAAGIRWQVRWRVMLDLLRADIGQFDPATANELDSLDRRLRSLFTSGPFLWEQELADSFPQENFWYLYLRA